jgi:uncharacterized protein (TIGR03435 family)
MAATIARVLRYNRNLLLLIAIALPIALCMPIAPILRAQTPAPPAAAHGDLTGDWQGTLEAGKTHRIILKVAKTDKGWSAKLFFLDDQATQSFNASAVVLDHSTFKFSVDLMGATYEATLNPDGASMAGTLTMGATPRPLNFVRATPETAWSIPAPTRAMAANADPAFEVATIKPNNSGAGTLQGMNINGRNFTSRNASLGDLISIAYGLHAKQIVGAPGWIDSDRYDIAALPDQEGEPNLQQVKIMIQKFLVDRFSFKFHHEKRDLSAYVLAVARSGQKLTPTESKGALPGLGFRGGPGGLVLGVQNASMSDFTGFLQSIVLDRPVVDQTALPGKFDFTVKFTPDDSQFNGHAPKLPASTDTIEQAPDLYTAIQQQIGLKLTVEKIPVDVLVIDHVEKPSPN